MNNSSRFVYFKELGGQRLVEMKEYISHNPQFIVAGLGLQES